MVVMWSDANINHLSPIVYLSCSEKPGLIKSTRRRQRSYDQNTWKMCDTNAELPYRHTVIQNKKTTVDE